MKRKHQNKPVRWLRKKCVSSGSDRLAFSVVAKEGGQPRFHELIGVSSFKVERHVKIRGEANSHDSRYEEFFREHKAGRMNWQLGNRLDAMTSP